MKELAGMFGCCLALGLAGCPSSPRTEPMDLPVAGEVSDEGTDLPGEATPPADLPGTDRSPIPDEAPADPGGGGNDPGSPRDTPISDPGADAGPRCTSTSECPLGFLCLDGDCREGCLSDRDCPRDLHCKDDEPPHGRCLACLTSDHCQEGQKV